MNINKLMMGAMTASLGLFAYGSLPQVSNVTMTQDLGRNVTITYNLDTAAVVTLDVQTNSADSGWVSIGGVAVCNAQGDVWKKVEEGNRTITWRPDLSWAGHKIAAGGARAVVTAWALNNTPDYMVVDISEGAQLNTQRYYPAVDFLPGSVLGQTGAVTNNPAYKTTMIVMRKIMAKGVTWTMGSIPGEIGKNTGEDSHQVTLTNNYYIGVFEVTQAQWSLLAGDQERFPSYFTKMDCRDMRPVENVCFNEIRMMNKRDSGVDQMSAWPAVPYSTSILGRLREKTGVDFDLPSEAEWEFAARAGNGSPCWGDGSIVIGDVTDENLSLLGRYLKNGELTNEETPENLDRNVGPEKGTAIVGSYKPNDWGLYDMHGNVFEWCLDWYSADISTLKGAVNAVEPTGDKKRVVRGGAWQYQASVCRSARRAAFTPGAYNMTGQSGLRLACKAGLD